MAPRVSVLLPYRNARATLPAAIGSALDQRGLEFELIAIDDGSSDGSCELVPPHPAVVALSSGGAGLVGALSTGLAAARGEWIARMDADDICLPDRFASQAARLSAQPALGALGTRVEAFADDGAVGAGMARYVTWQNRIIGADAHRRALFVESPLCHPSVMLRAEALRAVGGWRDVGWPEDYDLWLRLDAAGWALDKLPEVLLRWRQREGRATFADPRYRRECFLAAKAPHLARAIGARGRDLVIWGAGRTGKRLARALEPFAVTPRHFVDIDRKKYGRRARGRPICPPDQLTPGQVTVVVAVGALGARALIATELAARGFRDGHDLLFAA